MAAVPSISHHPTTTKVCQEPQPSSRVPAEARSAAGAGLPYVYPADCCSRQLPVLPIPRSTSTCLSCKACKTNSPLQHPARGSPPLLGALTTAHKAITTIKRPLCDDIQLGITTQLDSAPSDIADKALLGQESFLRH